MGNVLRTYAPCTSFKCHISSSPGEEVDFSLYDDAKVITGVLKQYLRELPQPIITYDAYSQIMKATGTGTCCLAYQGINSEACQINDTLQHSFFFFKQNMFLVLPTTTYSYMQ